VTSSADGGTSGGRISTREELVERLSELISMTPRSVDSVFPYRNGDGGPAYRPHQREAIQEIVDSVKSGKRYVIVEGPVGCGKSAIAYSVIRALGGGVYSTPVRSLIDQIRKEGWDNLSCVKGGAAYLCNACGFNERYNCKYDGENHKTCNNHDEIVDPGSYSTEKIIKIIKNTVLSAESSQDKKSSHLRSSFIHEASNGLLIDVIKDVEFSIFRSMYFFLENVLDSRKACIKKALESVTSKSVGRKLLCTIDQFECSLKSAKAILMSKQVKCMTLDMLRYLSLYMKEYDRNILVIDECQSIEGVVQRMYTSSMPAEHVDKVYGTIFCNASSFVTRSESSIYMREYYNSTIVHCYNYSKVVKRFLPYMHLKDYQSIMSYRSSGVLFSSIQSAAAEAGRDGVGEFSFMNTILITMFAPSKNMSNFERCISELVKMYMGEIDIYGMYLEDNQLAKMIVQNDFVLSCKLSVDKQILNGRDVKNLREMKSRILATKASELYKYSGYTVDISDDELYAYAISMFSQLVAEFVESINDIAAPDGSDTPLFCVGFENGEYPDDAVKMFDKIGYKFTGGKMMKITPVNIPRIMNGVFYNKFKHVVFMSGTWVDREGVCAKYGINMDDASYVKIPSTFDVSNRKIYCLDYRDNISFSEKVELGNGKREYLYKTPEGVERFCKHLYGTINAIRNVIKRERGDDNPNILIHCNSFSIVKIVAENYGVGLKGVSINNNWLIHLNEARVTNISGITLRTYDKGDIIKIASENRSKGLIILTPSMSEGVDFRDGMARAQIILKCPIPNIGDTYTDICVNGDKSLNVPRDPGYIDRAIMTTATQQYGRIVRGSDDWGYTVIFDKALTSRIRHLLLSGKRGGSVMDCEYLLDGVVYTYSKGGRMGVINFGEIK